MRICLISQEYPPETAHGGIGSQNYNKARALTRLGHEVHMLSGSARHDSTELRTDVEEGVTVHRIRPPEVQIPLYNPATFWVAYTWMVLRHLHDLIQAHNFDVIDFAEYGAEGFAYQLDRTLWNWVPVTVQLHGPLAIFTERIGWPDKDSDLHRVGSFMEGVSIGHADALMACSANIADFTAEYYGIPRDQIDVVHTGVDAEMFTPPVEGTQRDPVVLFVGNVAANKGVHTVLDAVLRIRTRHPEVRLHILGKGDVDTINALKRRAREADAEQSIEFVGFVGERARMPDFYRKASVFCSPGLSEPGVANVYIEAMACACPVIAATTGGGPEAVAEGKTGLLVAPKDVDGLEVAIERILSDPAAGRAMGWAGRERVETYFAMDRYINRVLATYQRAIERSKSKLDRLRAEAG
jgi:glycosyltransferase involved in cell wall biosynthesis